MKDAISLNLKSIRAASQLHAGLKSWLFCEGALDKLAHDYPGFDYDSVFLKVITLNELYSTRLIAKAAMARHIVDTIPEAKDLEDWQYVARIAALPPAPGKRQVRFVSFASKFAHFFIDGDRFPIYDRYALMMLKLHSGNAYVANQGSPYSAFYSSYAWLRSSLGEQINYRKMDCYLWLAGQYLAWKKGERKINSEILRLFESPTMQQKEYLKVILPQPDHELGI